jgi:AcrR family transcriptional regulator
MPTTTDHTTAEQDEIPEAPPTTRERIIYTTAELFRRQGYTGTGVKQILAESDAPFGSLYHHFPGGKHQLADEVIRQAGDFFRRLFEAIASSAPDPVTAMHEFFSGAAQTLRDTDYADACPIATVALEVASTDELLRGATADVFNSWIAAGPDGVVAAGLDRVRAREITIHMICALEGAFILSRAMRTTEPLEIAGRALVEELQAELDR